MLHDFITGNRAEIIERCRSKVSARPVPAPTPTELQNGVPLFLDQLAEILRLHTISSVGVRASATLHGDALQRMGFNVGQVVHDYGDICQSITELALERKAPIATAEFRTLNKCLDDAIANAVTQFSKQRDHQISAEGSERLGIFTHELRNLLNTALLSFEALRSGSVGVGGATGAVLGRSLGGLRELVDRSLSDARLVPGAQSERIVLGEFIDEVEVEAVMEARERGLRFTVDRMDGSAEVEADRRVLASAVANLLQNAFKFTHARGHVTLRSSADAARVRIEVEDECGGLPEGDPRSMFVPYKQRSTDRTGLGLGLAISRRGVEACGGVLKVRDLPGTGCVFTIDLPRAAEPVKLHVVEAAS